MDPLFHIFDVHVREELYFRDLDAARIARMHECAERSARAAALSATSGITDPAVLAALVEFGIGPELLVLLRFVPMLRVAWADLEIQSEERATILAAAAAEGIDDGSPARSMLLAWLDQPLDERIWLAWKAWVRGAPVRAACDGALDLAWSVARASGGILGVLGRISPAERAVLLECAAELDRCSDC